MSDFTQVFLAFLDKGVGEIPQGSPTPPRNRIGVVVTPWLGTPVPWFSITGAILLRQKGYQPFFIWDDLEFERDAASTAIQNIAIGEILGKLSGQGWTFVRLSQIRPGSVHERDAAIVEEAAFLNAQWIQTSAVPTPELALERARCLERLQANAPHIAGVLAETSPDMLIVPGGVYRNSGLFLHMGRLRGIDVSTYDSGSISMAVGFNSVASCFADLPAAFDKAVQAPVEIRRRMVAQAKEELYKRLMGKDKYAYQKSRPAGRQGGASGLTVFIPLNIETDATALGLSRFFDSSWDWLTQTIAFLLRQTSATVVVRQHPYEAKKPGDRMLLPNMLKKLFPSDRLVTHTCYDAVNSYELLASARLVLPYVSSMGIEAAMLGKEVITESRVYYAGMPFAYQASSKEDYFTRIATSLNVASFEPDPDAVEAAWIAYFLVTLCGRIWTKFTPQPQSFDVWANESLDDLWRKPAVRLLLKALAGTETVTSLQYEEYLGSKTGVKVLFQELQP